MHYKVTKIQIKSYRLKRAKKNNSSKTHTNTKHKANKKRITWKGVWYLDYCRKKKKKKREFIYNSGQKKKKSKNLSIKRKNSPPISNYSVKKFKIVSATAPASVTYAFFSCSQSCFPVFKINFSPYSNRNIYTKSRSSLCK